MVWLFQDLKTTNVFPFQEKKIIDMLEQILETCSYRSSNFFLRYFFMRKLCWYGSNDQSSFHRPILVVELILQLPCSIKTIILKVVRTQVNSRWKTLEIHSCYPRISSGYILRQYVKKLLSSSRLLLLLQPQAEHQDIVKVKYFDFYRFNLQIFTDIYLLITIIYSKLLFNYNYLFKTLI